MENMDARVGVYTATALGRGRMASPTLGSIYTRGKLPELSGHQDQSGTHEEVIKNLHSSDTRDRSRTVQPVAKRLVA